MVRRKCDGCFYEYLVALGRKGGTGRALRRKLSQKIGEAAVALRKTLGAIQISTRAWRYRQPLQR